MSFLYNGDCCFFPFYIKHHAGLNAIFVMPASPTFSPTVCSTSGHTDLLHLQLQKYLLVYTDGFNVPLQSKNIKHWIIHQSQSDITMAIAASCFIYPNLLIWALSHLLVVLDPPQKELLSCFSFSQLQTFQALVGTSKR